MTYVALLFRSGPLFFGDEAHLESAIVVGLIVSCAPTANNVVVMAELWGGSETKQALTAMIFLQYCIAPVSMTCWIIAIMMLLQNDGNASVVTSIA
jgi:predicted permease